VLAFFMFLWDVRIAINETQCLWLNTVSWFQLPQAMSKMRLAGVPSSDLTITLTQTCST
jgi:hypothetical protein